MDFHVTVKETIQAKRKILSWFAHTMTDLGPPFSRLWSMVYYKRGRWQSGRFCVDCPFNGHQCSYKCPTMSCTRQKNIKTSVYM